MQHDPPAEKSLVLDCGCGEKMTIIGLVEDWLSRNPVFRCNCGEKLTFSDDAKPQTHEKLKGRPQGCIQA